MNARGSCDCFVALPFSFRAWTHAFRVQGLIWPALSPASLGLNGGGRW